MADFPMFLIENDREEAGRGARDTIGGHPILPASESWPACPSDNEAVGIEGIRDQLPERYWDVPPVWGDPGRFWRILLHRDGTEPADDVEQHLRPYRLSLRPGTEEVTAWQPDYDPVERRVGRSEFKIGGVPSWAQDPESYRCACGAEMVYLCQVPIDMDFEKQANQPEQPDSCSSGYYGLFLGNEVYILACPAHCHPAAAWPVTQN
ncbi:hypothetical protein [Amycolatopsis kentuckyensis]|uniref:hypothetical protein n=1 Tax=Amycolatopsis kentuckyensis TaxID=218823 RepID=UPI001FC918B1|nr:hypothetical protein [Amycolatopsis kentuckyensis]